LQALHRVRRLSICVFVALCACGVWGCAGEPLVVLGDREPHRFRFEPPALVAELSVPAKTDNPTLTADLLEIVFTSEREGSADIYGATRVQRDEPFGAPQRLDAVSSSGVEASPAVSADGLTLWFGSDRSGGLGELDIWVATRAARAAAWSSPTNLAALNSDAQDIPRPPGQGARVMPMASDRERLGYYQIQFATRDASSAPFDAPEPVVELAFPDESTVDGFLSDDGLTLLYVTGPAFGPADLYVASRRHTADAFDHHTPLDDLNTDRDERDPWLSPDGSELYFASDRSGHYEIYVAKARREPAAVTP
jgi:Tol biopolymer transport system component